MERLQIIEQRLLTRPNLLEIATRLDVLADQDKMNPDEIVQAMQARTVIKSSAGRSQATIMTVTFEARTPKLAAEVLNEYLTQIQKDDASYRKGRAGQTLDFFEQEVDRLAAELKARGEVILEFKNKNSDALPDSLSFRQSQRADLQERLEQIGREIFTLKSQRQQLVTIFGETGQVGNAQSDNRSPAQIRYEQAQAELDDALLVYSESNPRVKMLRGRVEQLQKQAEAERADTPDTADAVTGNSALDFQLAGIDTRVSTLENQRESLEKNIARLTDTIDRPPTNTAALENLQREYDNIQGQYNSAVARLADASTGERIEILSRGERISVIEQPAIPSEPTKPNRLLIASGGTFLGVALGLGLVFLMVGLNSAPYRPEDLIKKLDIWPIATLPYTRTRRDLFLQRGRKLFVILIILVGVPMAVWALHVYYQPLDLIADRIMNKLGVRW